MTATGSEKLTFDGVSARTGIPVTTLYGYRSRPTRANPFPQPDGWFNKRTPWWWSTTIDVWMAARPGAGTRSDLKTITSDTTGDV